MEEERRVALKFAYDGTKFFGFQRQPEKLTIEGTLVNALARVGAIRSSRDCGYRSSSRTDRGVSALGNIVSFNTSFPANQLCSAINSEMLDVWSYSAVEVPQDFNPRGATQRWYRYYLARSGQNEATMREIASRFVGVHDFSGYARRDKRNPMRKIDSIDVSSSGPFHEIDFRAESFLWNMVRRIVWMVNEGSSDRLPLDQIGPESRKKPIRVGLARPEYLVLMDIECGIEFPVDDRAAKAVGRWLEMTMKEHRMSLAFSQSLISRLGANSPRAGQS